MWVLVRKPIDFGGGNHQQRLTTDYQGYIISHIGTKHYRKNRNCSLTLEGLTVGDNFTIIILENNLKNKNPCYDSLTIISGETSIKVCGKTTLKQWNKTLGSPELLFWFKSNWDTYVGSFQIEYTGQFKTFHFSPLSRQF